MKQFDYVKVLHYIKKTHTTHCEEETPKKKHSALNKMHAFQLYDSTRLPHPRGKQQHKKIERNLM